LSAFDRSDDDALIHRRASARQACARELT